jgi:hypothetical protein
VSEAGRVDRQRRAGLAVAVGSTLGGVLGATSLLAGCDGWWPQPDRAGGWTAPGSLDGGWIGSDPPAGHRLRDANPGSDAPRATSARRVDVLVLGGGVAGLSCLRALQQAGIADAELIELESEVGGNSRGHRLGGLPCPLGAHYLPVPDRQTTEVHDWLHEIGLLRLEAGRSLPDERHLCHSPQERLFIDGAWQEGLWPLPEAFAGAEAPALQREYERLAQRVSELQRSVGFSLPADRTPWTAAHAALDAQTFAQWLDAEGLRHPALRWMLDYACRDDYGAPAASVSAWAGLHYFASRHGVRAPGIEAEEEAVFTWPEGNAWLVERLAAPRRAQIHAQRLALRVEPEGAGPAARVRVEALNLASNTAEAWSARQLVLATPLFIAARLLRAAPWGSADPGLQALAEAARRLTPSPWLVANLLLKGPVADRHGAPPAWDNVVYGEAALGYVDAAHQTVSAHPLGAQGPRVWTAYWALGGSGAAAALGIKARDADLRRALLEEPWRLWAERVCRPLLRAHPDLGKQLQRIDLARHGHAMATPVPGLRSHPALVALRQAAVSGGIAGGRIHLAHSDLAGYSVFEEAFTIGHRVGQRVAQLLGQGRAQSRGGQRAPMAPRR